MFKLFLFATILALAASAPAPAPTPKPSGLIAPILPLTYQLQQYPSAYAYQYQNQYAPTYYYKNYQPLVYQQPLQYQSHYLI